MAFAFEREHLVLEGAAAVGIAAILHGRVSGGLGRSVALVLSGTNVDSGVLFDVVVAHRNWVADLE